MPQKIFEIKMYDTREFMIIDATQSNGRDTTVPTAVILVI